MFLYTKQLISHELNHARMVAWTLLQCAEELKLIELERSQAAKEEQRAKKMLLEKEEFKKQRLTSNEEVPTTHIYAIREEA